MNRPTSTSLRWLGKLAAIAATTLMTTVTAQTARSAIAATGLEETAIAAEPVAVSQLFDTPQYCADDLSQALTNIVRQPQFSTANWGIFVSELDDPDAIYAYNSDTFLIPASNIKLFTTAAAMQIIAQRDPARLVNFRDDLTIINRNSNNARADNLLRTIGGQTQVQAALAPLGILPDDFVQADGSGLSRENKVKPQAVVTLLKGMYASDDSHLFYDSLPVGGVSGTLRNRFKGSPVQGRVHAKTGTLRGVRALSGYLETEEAGTVTFSIVVNQPGQSGRVMLDAIDAMVLQMAQLDDC